MSLQISSVEDGAILSAADDIDAERSGTQLNIRATVSGLATFSAVGLSIDGELVALGAVEVTSAVTFERVTLPPGTHQLVARTLDQAVRSDSVRYTLRQLTITEPTDGTRLSASSDEDPNQAGIQRSVRVQSDGLELTDDVTLRIDDQDTATLRPDADGLVSFARQTFAPGDHTLQVVAGDVRSAPVAISVGPPCPVIDVITPQLAEAGMPMTLGPDDDVLGPTCGDEFAIELIAATNAGSGSTLRLSVNGSVRSSAVVEGTVARFSSVILGNRGNTANRLAIEVVHEGTTCRSEIDNPIFVDCDGASCEITAPTAAQYLNAALDRSLAPGFQGQFEVSTDLSTPERQVALIVDGDALNSRFADALARGAAAVATFSVGLSEGTHRMLALCTDDSGNVTASGERSWTVDTTGCGVTIASPRNNAFFLDSDDVDSAIEGTQIDVMASVVGTDCERGRAGICGGLQGLPLLPIVGNTPVSRVTLSTAATQGICYEVNDAAGNPTLATTQIHFDSEAPELSIRTPTHGSRFNVLGNAHMGQSWIADLNASTPACDVAFEVECSDLETDVTLNEYVSGATIAGATAPCDANTAPSATLPGIARFASVALPRLGTVALFARQVAAGGRLVGVSSPITLVEDCQPPTLTITSGGDPLCDDVLGPSLSDPDGSSITRDITVTSDDPANVSRVRLRVAPISGSAPIADITDNTAPFVFDNVNFSAFGEHDVVIDAQDQAGNAANAPSCRVSVVDAPALALTLAEGADADSTFEDEDDCSGDSGLQLTITGSTNAPAGTVATITVGSVSYFSTVSCTGPDCGFSVCVDAPEGLVSVRAQVTDPSKPTSGVVERQILVDSLPPTTAISDLRAEAAVGPDTRQGRVTLRWTDVADEGGTALSGYALRCAAAPIGDETQWLAADVMSLTLQPDNPGAERAATLEGFSLYTPRHCRLRAIDAGGALTPIGDDLGASIDLGLGARTWIGADGDALGQALAAVGDVNGDELDDFVVGGVGVARLYFGQAMLDVDALRSVVISGPGDSFGARVAGLGDINGDGISDFAVGEPDAGTVYLFLGRREIGAPVQTYWPSTLDALLDASITFRSTADDGLGDALSAAGDVNGDGYADLAIGAPTHDLTSGRVHVVLGGPLCSVDITDHCLLLGSTTTLGPSGGTVDGFVIRGTDGARLGTSLAGAGDLDDDGFDELLIGAAGDQTLMVDATLYELAGSAWPDGSVGMSEVALGALTATRLAAPEQAGRAMAVSRTSNALTLLITRGAEVAIVERDGSGAWIDEARLTHDLSGSGDGFGASLAAGAHPTLPLLDCDVNADGMDDVFIGSAGRVDALGSAELFDREALRAARDNTGAVERSDSLVVWTSDSGALQVACVGDINGDGASDLAHGDPDANGGAGAITVRY